MGYPEILGPAGSLWARAFGDDFMSLGPIAGVAKIGSRPFQIVHGTNDLRVNVHHATDGLAVQQRANPAATAWLIPNGGHVEGPFLATAEYERRLGAFFHSALGA